MKKIKGGIPLICGLIILLLTLMACSSSPRTNAHLGTWLFEGAESRMTLVMTAEGFESIVEYAEDEGWSLFMGTRGSLAHVEGVTQMTVTSVGVNSSEGTELLWYQEGEPGFEENMSEITKEVTVKFSVEGETFTINYDFDDDGIYGGVPQEKLIFQKVE